MPKLGETDTAEGLVNRGTAAALKTLRQLMRLGCTDKRRHIPDPPPTTPAEARDYAKVRLEAAKFFLVLRFGSKARGPLKPDDAARARENMDEFLALPPAERDIELERCVFMGEITEEQADEIRRDSFAARRVLDGEVQSEVVPEDVPHPADPA